MLVIDYASSNNTKTILGNYQENDSQHKFFKRTTHRKKVVYSCSNIGMENAKRGYIQFLDSDDLIAIHNF